jgi:ATP-binding protein involved in chromosome partitioning
VAVDHGDGALRLRWADGVEQTLADRDLRLGCACAKCRDEMTSSPLLDPESVPLDVSLTRVWSIGNYALGMAFSDGHDTGIYTFRALRQMAGTEFEDV